MGCRWLPRRATSAGRCARSVPTGRTCSCSILEASPDTAIVILTMQGEPGLARAALRAGARAFVLKDEAGAELVAAVRAAATGSRYVNPQLGARIAAEPDGRAEPPDHLNDRELEVLKLVAVGHTSMEIGRQLNLSVRTVENHRSRILKKTRRSSRAELVAYARASTASLTSDTRYLAAGPALTPLGDALGAGPDGAADGLMAVPRGGRTDRTKGLTQVGTPFGVNCVPNRFHEPEHAGGTPLSSRRVRAARGHVWFRALCWPAHALRTTEPWSRETTGYALALSSVLGVVPKFSRPRMKCAQPSAGAVARRRTALSAASRSRQSRVGVPGARPGMIVVVRGDEELAGRAADLAGRLPES